MQDTVIRDPALEDALVAARRDPDTPLGTLIAIAHQCFNAEYVLNDEGCSPPVPHDERSAALYPAYKPLSNRGSAPASLVSGRSTSPPRKRGFAP